MDKWIILKKTNILGPMFDKVWITSQNSDSYLHSVGRVIDRIKIQWHNFQSINFGIRNCIDYVQNPS